MILGILAFFQARSSFVSLGIPFGPGNSRLGHLNRGLSRADNLNHPRIGASQRASVIESRQVGYHRCGRACYPGCRNYGGAGLGVNTPRAAAVADATAGLARDEQTPKGKMFINGTLSMMLAIGILVVKRFFGKTISAEGAAPNEHCNDAPPQTTMPIE